LRQVAPQKKKTVTKARLKFQLLFS